MSHFTTLKTTITDKARLIQALQSLGYQPEVGNVSVRGYGGRQTPADVLIRMKDSSYGVGFRKAGKTYELVADWFGIKEISQDTLLQQVTQRYAYHAARDKLEAQGFALAAQEVRQDGRIHLVLRRMS